MCEIVILLFFLLGHRRDHELNTVYVRCFRFIFTDFEQISFQTIKIR